MPRRSKNRRRPKRRARVMGFTDTPCTHTLSVTFTPTVTGTSPYGSYGFSWDQLVGFTPLSEFYEFFVPVSYRVSAMGFSPNNSFPEVFALYPWDYIS
jgi:hypothetical protein